MHGLFDSDGLNETHRRRAQRSAEHTLQGAFADADVADGVGQLEWLVQVLSDPGFERRDGRVALGERAGDDVGGF